MIAPWHTSAVFAAMREIGADSERRLENSRALMPRYGEIAVGGAHMDDFFPGDALAEFLRALRKGILPDEAARIAKAAARESVRKWNRHRGDDYQTHRWAGTADDVVERAAVRIRQAMRPAKAADLFGELAA